MRPSLLALPALVLAVAAEAQPTGGRSAREGSILFFADVATFFDPDSRQSRVELFVSVPLTSLHFSQEAGAAPVSGVEILAILYDDGDRQVTGDEWICAPIRGSLDREENEGRSINRRYPFTVEPGRYTARVRVREIDTGQAGSLDLPFVVPDRAAKDLAVADPVFGLCPDLVASAPSGQFVGGILPFPSRRYGEDTPGICVHWEIYDRLGPEGGESCTVHFRVRDETGATREDSTFTVPRSGRIVAVTLSPRFAGLNLGSYRLELEAGVGGEKARAEGVFSIDETRIAFIQDAEKLRTVLGYIATNEELRLLHETPDDSLGAYWEEFWRRRNPNPDLRRNEALVEFLRRVDHATRQFGVLEPGWRSDMGRIYIRYGAPDNVERIMNDPYRPATEIWYYYTRNATYVFQDPDGFGRFRLVGTRRD